MCSDLQVRHKRMLFADWQSLNERFDLDVGNKNGAMVQSAVMGNQLEAKRSTSSPSLMRNHLSVVLADDLSPLLLSSSARTSSSERSQP